RPFSGGPANASGKVQVSSNGGDFPVWQRDGKELFFIGADLKLYSVDTSGFRDSGRTLHPTPLFAPCHDTALDSLPARGTYYNHPYDVSPDGQRFLFNCKTQPPTRFDVLLNWASSRSQ